MGEVLKKGGYNVEYVQADYLAQFAGLESGDLHVAMEIWETTGREAMDAATLTRNLQPLVAAGWVVVGEGVNARSRLLTLTEAGREVRQTAQRHWKNAQLELNGLLGPARVAELHGLLDQALAAFEPETSDE